MCSIAAMAAVSIGTQIIGNVMKTSANQRAADANINYLKNLSETSYEQADEVLDAAALQQKYISTNAASELDRTRDEFKKTIGAQKTVIAANGIGSGSVTAQNLALDALTESQKDEELIRYNAEVTSDEISRGSKFQAKQLRKKGQQYKDAAADAAAAKRTDFLASILGGASDTAGSIIDYSRYS